MKSIEERLEDIALGLSIPVDRLNTIFNHIKSKDRMDGDDLRQLTELGLPFISTLAGLVFESPQTVNEMIKEGKVNFFLFTTVIKYLTSKEGLFYNLKEKQSQTWGAQYERAFKQEIIKAYNAGYEDCENKGMGDLSAEQYYNETFSSHLKEKS